ncbi:MAG: class I tRNA ligase family protein, partial [Propionibacteriales bacterium]|nr:class I tRNA ligase family protein [Propionibacteriales bacterium]
MSDADDTASAPEPQVPQTRVTETQAQEPPASDPPPPADEAPDAEAPANQAPAVDAQPPQTRVPAKPALEGLEDKWTKSWEEQGTYRFDRSAASRDQVYAIDTPPPTVSGSLHVGHVFSYTHTDTIARFQRMSGKEVF